MKSSRVTLEVKGTLYLGAHIPQEGPFVACGENGEWPNKDRTQKDLGLMVLSAEKLGSTGSG